MMGQVTFLFVYLLIFIGVPVVIGVYVYRDAKRRDMNAALWVLISVLAPVFIGFIIFLIVRSSYSDLKCPACGGSVTEQYAVCPNCGTKLKTSCPNCGFSVESGWTVCPKCTLPLPEEAKDVIPPVKKQDRGLWKVLVVVVLVPLLLVIGLTVFSLSSYTGGGASSVPIEITNTYVEEDQGR